MQRNIFVFFSLLIFIVFPVIGQAASFGDRVNTMSKIEQIRISTADEKVRIVLDASKPVSYKTFVLSNPNRVAIDIKGAWLSPDIIKETLVDSSCVGKVRVRQFDADTVRVVIETNVSQNGYEIFSLPANANTSIYRIVFDFGDEQKNLPAVVEESPSTLVVPTVAIPNAMPGIRGKTIVIDPGHGGSDSGAVGTKGIMEKDITLAISKQLQGLLTDAGAKVIMTRTSDVDVARPSAEAVEELQARVDVANRARADLFLSIHMDSFSSSDAKGTSTYYYAKGTPASQRLANLVRSGIIEQLGTEDRGTKTCNFYVVKHTTMPAALAEVAFVSNPGEGQLLTSTDGTKKAAQGIYNGIRRYFQ
ncbi:N-acetylmuramoyl-L-alanine amidase [Propionispira arboris]|uniref:N-acetylmuramoyl-L-alanine amidase n=1 Tax=Propionispira arboris TaxID=84035 RepID=A0A1H6UD20_9FIRM|nr:N-acetylmuramoyl-L-alanine amidase [Propionispira arboris]SEI88534.1 N-acetylmuramoyl-L-alanine amidase [Propionispira arboris]